MSEENGLIWQELTAFLFKEGVSFAVDTEMGVCQDTLMFVVVYHRGIFRGGLCSF